jgi:hypothetical protein
MREEMTINKARNWAIENGLNPEKVINRIKYEVKRSRMSWQSINLKTGDEEKIDITSFGYRKKTTGEYVPKAYLSHFGWKNTYYESAQLIITFVNNKEAVAV